MVSLRASASISLLLSVGIILSSSFLLILSYHFLGMIFSIIGILRRVICFMVFTAGDISPAKSCCSFLKSSTVAMVSSTTSLVLPNLLLSSLRTPLSAPALVLFRSSETFFNVSEPLSFLLEPPSSMSMSNSSNMSADRLSNLSAPIAQSPQVIQNVGIVDGMYAKSQ